MIIVEEMTKFRKLLDEKNIPWEDRSHDNPDNGLYICRTWGINKKWSVINGFGTYGGYSLFEETNAGKLEFWVPGTEPIGYLTAEEAILIVEAFEFEDEVKKDGSI